MPPVVPYIPQQITVHLGSPSSNAENVTVSFSDYVKNVASSEIYPTWDEDALKANILAIVSFALNRIYTEFYRSRGYDFDITSSTAYDQFFVKGRSFFENVSELVDELFNDYLRRPGFVEPLAAKFCNGTTVTCEGLSQWGSQNLAQQGYSADQILRSYYGDIEISQNYPAIPKIPVVDGIFGPKTERAVIQMQQIFGLNPDGIVGRATWYEIVRLYTAVTRLSELRSQGQQFYAINWEAPNSLSIGDTGDKVRHLQYMLSILSSYIPEIPPVTIDGIYGERTRAAVLAAQRRFRLPETGSVGKTTWDEIYDQYSGIENTSLRDSTVFPNTSQESVPAGNIRRPADSQSNSVNYARTTTLTQFPGRDLSIGSRDRTSQEVIR